MRAVLLLFLVCAILYSCSGSKDTLIIHETGTIAGSDTTCGGWLIQNQDSVLLQPLNLSDFTVTVKFGQPVIFSYYKQPVGHICQVAETIKLVKIEDR